MFRGIRNLFGATRSSESNLGFLQIVGLGDPLGTSISAREAMRATPIFSAVNFLSSSMAQVPINMFRVDSSGSKERTNDWRGRWLNGSWAPEWTSEDARRYLMEQMCLYGAGYAKMERNGEGQVHSIIPLEFSEVQAEWQNGVRTYMVKGKPYTSREILAFVWSYDSDQITPISPITMCAGAIKLYLAMENYSSRFFTGGGIPAFALKGNLPNSDNQKENEESMALLRKQWESNIRKANERGIPIMVPSGMELEPLGSNVEQSQLNQSKNNQLNEMARVFQLPPLFLQDLSKGTYSNTEQQGLHVTKHVLGRHYKRWESQLTLRMFGRNQRMPRFEVEFDLSELERGDFRARVDSLARGVQTGMMTHNEARVKLGLPTFEGDAFNTLYVQKQMVPLNSAEMVDNNPPPADDQDASPPQDEGDGENVSETKDGNEDQVQG